jgi:hypothetical protein
MIVSKLLPLKLDSAHVLFLSRMGIVISGGVEGASVSGPLERMEVAILSSFAARSGRTEDLHEAWKD